MMHLIPQYCIIINEIISRSDYSLAIVRIVYIKDAGVPLKWVQIASAHEI